MSLQAQLKHDRCRNSPLNDLQKEVSLGALVSCLSWHYLAGMRSEADMKAWLFCAQPSASS